MPRRIPESQRIRIPRKREEVDAATTADAVLVADEGVPTKSSSNQTLNPLRTSGSPLEPADPKVVGVIAWCRVPFLDRDADPRPPCGGSLLAAPPRAARRSSAPACPRFTHPSAPRPHGPGDPSAGHRRQGRPDQPGVHCRAAEGRRRVLWPARACVSTWDGGTSREQAFQLRRSRFKEDTLCSGAEAAELAGLAVVDAGHSLERVHVLLGDLEVDLGVGRDMLRVLGFRQWHSA